MKYTDKEKKIRKAIIFRVKNHWIIQEYNHYILKM
jgi:hypothetical protein